MTCVYCKGNIEESIATYMTDYHGCYIIIKNVPCEKCTQCGEEYFSTSVAEKLESILDSIQKISSEITVTVIDYKSKVA